MQLLTNCAVKKIGLVSPDRLNNPYSYGVRSSTPTFISVGATDYLKKDAFAWAHKPKDAGVDKKMVVYNGMGQGYLNATGVFLQAEDVLNEMVDFICKFIKQ